MSPARRTTWPVPLAALIVAAVGIPIALAYATGAMQIPRIDDWAFQRVAVDLYSTGHLHLIGWGEMTMIGHELWGVPFVAAFGHSIEALHWAGAVIAALGLAGTFSLYRRFLSPQFALFGTAAIAVLPVFAILATTYMTDLTGYAGEVLCLTLGVAALRSTGRRSTALLVGSLLVGFWAFTCRESSIAAPAAVVLGELLRARRNGTPLAKPIAFGLGLLVAAAALYGWRKGLPGDQSTPFARPGLLTLEQTPLVLVDSYFGVALGLLPILLLCSRGAVRAISASRSARWVALAVGLVGLLLVAVPHYPSHESGTVLDGNLLSKFGSGGPQTTPNGGRDPLFPAALWLALNIVAVAAGAFLTAAIWATAPVRASTGTRRRLTVSRPRPDLGVVLLYTAFTVALLIFRAVEKGFLIDRYDLSLTMALGLLTLLSLSDRGPVSVRRGAGAIAVVALLSALVVLDVNAFDKERWSAAEAAVAQGVPATEISAGFEWIGAHHPGAIPENENILGSPDRCVLVTPQPLHGGSHQLREVRTYAPVGGVFERHLWVYREPARCGTAAGTP